MYTGCRGNELTPPRNVQAKSVASIIFRSPRGDNVLDHRSSIWVERQILGSDSREKPLAQLPQRPARNERFTWGNYNS